MITNTAEERDKDMSLIFKYSSDIIFILNFILLFFKLMLSFWIFIFYVIISHILIFFYLNKRHQPEMPAKLKKHMFLTEHTV
jgi:hypothetical protein